MPPASASNARAASARLAGRGESASCSELASSDLDLPFVQSQFFGSVPVQLVLMVLFFWFCFRCLVFYFLLFLFLFFPFVFLLDVLSSTGGALLLLLLFGGGFVPKRLAFFSHGRTTRLRTAIV